MTKADKLGLGTDDQVAIAVAHLSMISQAALGVYKPRPGEIQTRQAWLTEYIKTGQGMATPVSQTIVRHINKLLADDPLPAPAAVEMEESNA